MLVYSVDERNIINTSQVRHYKIVPPTFKDDKGFVLRAYFDAPDHTVFLAEGSEQDLQNALKAMLVAIGRDFHLNVIPGLKGLDVIDG